jgi:hypothetical protein
MRGSVVCIIKDFITVCIKSGTFVHKVQEETVNEFDNDVTSKDNFIFYICMCV